MEHWDKNLWPQKNMIKTLHSRHRKVWVWLIRRMDPDPANNFIPAKFYTGIVPLTSHAHKVKGMHICLHYQGPFFCFVPILFLFFSLFCLLCLVLFLLFRFNLWLIKTLVLWNMHLFPPKISYAGVWCLPEYYLIMSI